jgi:hypothetical protein
MTGRQRTRATSPTTNAVRLALAGVAVSLGALAMAGQANADPEVPATPGAAPPAPGQPVAEAPVAPAPPPPVGTPTVPEIQDPQYGSGGSGGTLGFLRDAWHEAQDPYGYAGTPPGEMPMSSPPPGAGPPPPLPPGYVSTNAPGSETASVATGPPRGGPALPPGYYSTSGPPPPGYFDPPPDPRGLDPLTP